MNLVSEVIACDRLADFGTKLDKLQAGFSSETGVDLAVQWLEAIDGYECSEPLCFNHDPTYTTVDGLAIRGKLEEYEGARAAAKAHMARVSNVAKMVLEKVKDQRPDALYILAQSWLKHHAQPDRETSEYSPEKQDKCYEDIYQAAQQGYAKAKLEYGIWALGYGTAPIDRLQAAKTWLEEICQNEALSNWHFIAKDMLEWHDRKG